MFDYGQYFPDSKHAGRFARLPGTANRNAGSKLIRKNN